MGVDRSHAPGDTVAGYVVEGLAGRGGMGEVYRARDPRLDRPVALKLLSPALAEDARLRERLVRESRLAASLDHPNVVPVYEAGEADGRLFIAMRFVEGTDLRALLREQGALDPARAMAPAAQVAGALDAAHARGLVHRDVKPSNVLIDQADGREHAYLADFGLTQSAAERGPAEGQLMGTLEYVAPEQIRGDEVDGRADVYALGCLLFETLTGTLPFAGMSDVALIYAHLEMPPPRATERRPELPEAVDAVLARAMAKDPDDRQERCGTLVSELEDALGLRPTGRDLLRRRLPGIGIAAALAAIVVAVAVILLTQGAAPAAAAPTGSVVRIDPKTNAVAGRFPVGADPGAIAAASGRVWVVLPVSAQVIQVNPASGEVRPVTATGAPRDVAALGQTVYVLSDGAGFEQGALTPYDAQTAQRRSGIPAQNCSIAASREFGIAAAACPFVQRIQDRASRLTALWQTPIPAPLPPTTETLRICLCDMSLSGTTLWVSGDPVDRHVWRLDADGRLVSTIAVPVGGPLEDRLVRIDATTDRVTDVLATGRGAQGVAVGAGSVWVTHAIDGTVARRDPATGRVLATVRTGGRPGEITVGDGAVWVSVDDA